MLIRALRPLEMLGYPSTPAAPSTALDQTHLLHTRAHTHTTLCLVKIRIAFPKLTKYPKFSLFLSLCTITCCMWCILRVLSWWVLRRWICHRGNWRDACHRWAVGKHVPVGWWQHCVSCHINTRHRGSQPRSLKWDGSSFIFNGAWLLTVVQSRVQGWKVKGSFYQFGDLLNNE